MQCMVLRYCAVVRAGSQCAVVFMLQSQGECFQHTGSEDVGAGSGAAFGAAGSGALGAAAESSSSLSLEEVSPYWANRPSDMTHCRAAKIS